MSSAGTVAKRRYTRRSLEPSEELHLVRVARFTGLGDEWAHAFPKSPKSTVSAQEWMLVWFSSRVLGRINSHSGAACRVEFILSKLEQLCRTRQRMDDVVATVLYQSKERCIGCGFETKVERPKPIWKG